MFGTAEAKAASGQKGTVLFGDDAEAQDRGAQIIDKTGYFPVDLGTLDAAGPLASLPFGSLAAINFLKIEVDVVRRRVHS